MVLPLELEDEIFSIAAYQLLKKMAFKSLAQLALVDKHRHQRSVKRLESAYPSKLSRLFLPFGRQRTHGPGDPRPIAHHIRHLAVAHSPTPGNEDFSSVGSVQSLLLVHSSIRDAWIPDFIRLARSWPLQRLWLGYSLIEGHHPLLRVQVADEPFPPFHGCLTHLCLHGSTGFEYFIPGHCSPCISPCIKRNLTHLNLSSYTDITWFFTSLATCVSSLPALEVLALCIPYKAIVIDAIVTHDQLPFDPRIVFYMLYRPINGYADSWYEYVYGKEGTFGRLAEVI